MGEGKRRNRTQFATLVIDPTVRTVTERKVVNRLATWQAIVGGMIEQVVTLPDAHAIWANEEGLYREPYHWWTLANEPVVISGPAFIVKHLDTVEGTIFAGATLTQAQLTGWVRFLTTDEARERWEDYRAWQKAEAARKAERFKEQHGTDAITFAVPMPDFPG